MKSSGLCSEYHHVLQVKERIPQFFIFPFLPRKVARRRDFLAMLLEMLVHGLLHLVHRYTLGRGTTSRLVPLPMVDSLSLPPATMFVCRPPLLLAVFVCLPLLLLAKFVC